MEGPGFFPPESLGLSLGLVVAGLGAEEQLTLLCSLGLSAAAAELTAAASCLALCSCACRFRCTCSLSRSLADSVVAGAMAVLMGGGVEMPFDLAANCL